jgi:bifunctional UDP-N-acetylglucosamine pyrophosphorylase/glucosamine-1-phosphate N-acetyltransferase
VHSATGCLSARYYDALVPAPTVVILAAGEGTRMRSSLPKMLHPLCGRPLIAWPIAAAREAGAGKVVVVDGPKRRLAEHVPDGVVTVVQEEPRGTGDAVAAAAGEIRDEETVVILLGDDPLLDTDTIADLVTAHEESGAAATMLTAELDDPAGYGRVVRDAEGQVDRVVETKTPGDATDQELAIREVNTGIFAFDGRALRTALSELRADNAQGELYLPDVLPRLHEAGHAVGAHPAANWDRPLGVNDRVDLADVRAYAQRRINERHMLAGVTIVDPATAYIDATVTIGADTTIEPGVQLKGETTIGAGVTIGAHTTIVDSKVGDGATILRAHLDRAEVGPEALVGPFAYLRPDTVLHRKAKAGTYVEIKNSTIGEGTKVPHLSYIGDADIGEGTNIGASNITANYDGVNKHRTTIGARVHTSVDTAFVAPVTVGDDAYTGAGSVITEDVPAGALGIARARQSNIEGYAERVSRRKR